MNDSARVPLDWSGGLGAGYVLPSKTGNGCSSAHLCVNTDRAPAEGQQPSYHPLSVAL